MSAQRIAELEQMIRDYEHIVAKTDEHNKYRDGLYTQLCEQAQQMSAELESLRSERDDAISELTKLLYQFEAPHFDTKRRYAIQDRIMAMLNGYRINDETRAARPAAE